MDKTLAEGKLGILLDALAVERSLYVELITALERERTALVNMSADEMLGVTPTKEAVISRIQAQSGAIEQAMAALASALGVARGHERISLSRLIDHLEGTSCLRLQEARNQVVALSETASVLNRANDRLLHRSLTYVNHYLTFLQSLMTAAPGYLHTGAAPDLARSGRIVAVKG
jgi:hypothetical protein